MGRGSYDSGGIPNPLTKVPGVEQGTLLKFLSPTAFTGDSLMQALPSIRANLAAQRGNPNNTDFAVTNIEVDKQGSVVDSHMPNASSVHLSFGVQREIARDFVINADVVYRHFAHVGGPQLVDVNHFSSARGPALRICEGAERTNPKASCSLGPINLTSGIGSVSGMPVFSGNTMTVNLTGVANAQTLTVTLSGVSDEFSQVLPDTPVSVNMLIGDTSGNGVVNATDVAQTKGQVGQPVTSSNFRTDVNASGIINATDVAIVKAHSGQSISAHHARARSSVAVAGRH